MYWKLKFLRDRDENAAARGSVELGHDKTGDPGDAAKNLDLVNRVLADGRIEDEKNGMRRAGIRLFYHPYDFFEFCHELCPVLQAPCGVHQHNVRTTFPRALHRIESEPRGIAALFARDHGTIEALAPDAQLRDRGGAERIASGKDDAHAIGFELRRELADGCRLAGSIHPDHENDEWLLAGIDLQRPGIRGQHTLDFRREDRLDFVDTDILVIAAMADRFRDSSRRGDSEIGANQHVLQIVEH